MTEDRVFFRLTRLTMRPEFDNRRTDRKLSQCDFTILTVIHSNGHSDAINQQANKHNTQ